MSAFFSTIFNSPSYLIIITSLLFLTLISLITYIIYSNFIYKKLLRTLKRGNIFVTFFHQEKRRFSYLTKRKNIFKFRELNFKTFDEFLNHFEETEHEGIRLAFKSLKQQGRPISLTLTTKKGQNTYRLNAHSFRGNSKWAVIMLHDTSKQETEKAALRLECKMLSSSLNLYKKTFDHLPWPLWIRENHELLYCNPACARLFEQSSFESASYSNTPLTFKMLKRDLLGNKQPKAIVFEGSRHLFCFKETPFTDRAILGYGEDLTKLHAKEKQLNQHLSSYREVLESLSAGVAIYDEDQNLSYCNKAYVRSFDFDENWLHSSPHIGEVLDDLRSRRLLTEHADYNAYKKEQINFLKTITTPHETIDHLPDGRSIRLIVSPHPMGGSFYILEDLTDRLKLEAKYNTQLAVHRATLDNLFEGVAVFGSDNRLQFSNQAFSDIWNIDKEKMRRGEHISVLAENVRHLISPEKDWKAYKSRVMSLVDRQYKTRKIHRGDGRTIEFSYIPLPDGSNLMSYHDITDQLELEIAYEQRILAQQNADRLKSDFISNMSYEMRSPLNTIIGYSELLQQTAKDKLLPEQLAYCQDIQLSSKRLLNLVNNILDLAMIEAGHIQLKRSICDFWEVFSQTIDQYNQQCEPDCPPLHIDIPLKPALVLADKGYLVKALETLLLNISKFQNPSIPLAIDIEQNDQGLTLCFIQKLPSERSNSSDIEETLLPGKTLALSLIQHILEEHQACFEESIHEGTKKIRIHFELTRKEIAA